MDIEWSPSKSNSSKCSLLMYAISTVCLRLQSQTMVTGYFTDKQLLLFVLVWRWSVEGEREWMFYICLWITRPCESWIQSHAHSLAQNTPSHAHHAPHRKHSDLNYTAKNNASSTIFSRQLLLTLSVWVVNINVGCKPIKYTFKLMNVIFGR